MTDWVFPQTSLGMLHGTWYMILITFPKSEKYAYQSISGLR